MSGQYVYVEIPRAVRLQKALIACAFTLSVTISVGLLLHGNDAPGWTWPCLALFALVSLFPMYRFWTTTRQKQLSEEGQALLAEKARASDERTAELWKKWVWRRWYVRYTLAACVALVTFAMLSYVTPTSQRGIVVFWIAVVAGGILTAVLAYEIALLSVAVGLVWWGVHSLAAEPPARIALLLAFILLPVVGFSLYDFGKSLKQIRRSQDEIKQQQDEMRRAITQLQMKSIDRTSRTYHE